MKNFLSDLWHDLREKRLWPVALVLLAALVAVPVVLSKSSEEPPPPAPVATEARTAPEPRDLKGLARVKLEESIAGKGSSLDTFDPSNPFRPPRKVLQSAEEAESAAGSGSGPSSAAATDGDTGSGGSTGGSQSTGKDGGSGPGDTGGGDTGPDDTGGGTGGGDTGGGDTTTQYTYVIDVTFRANGRRARRIKGLERLDMLPNLDSPLLLFLGVSPKGGNAVFLVDSTLEAVGEGRCQPSREDCAFLHIGAGSEHEFTNDEGDSYTLRVDEIRRVRIGAKASVSKKDTKTADAAVGRPAPARRFALPLLADLVSVSSAGGNDSNSDKDRR